MYYICKLINICVNALVSCTLYSLHCTLYAVQCTPYNVQCTLVYDSYNPLQQPRISSNMPRLHLYNILHST